MNTIKSIFSNISNTFKKPEFINVCKLVIFLIVLCLAIRILTTPPHPDIIKNKTTNYEGFESFITTNMIYGNELVPTYSNQNNQSIFTFSGVSRIDTIKIRFNSSFTVNTSTSITLQYIDTNGNTMNIINDKIGKSDQITMQSDTNGKFISIVPVLNDNSQYVYTNQIILSIGDSNNAGSNLSLDSYIDSYGFYGRNRGDLSYDDFQQQLSGTNKNITPSSVTTNASITKFILDKDYLIYSMKLSLDSKTFPNFDLMRPDNPYSLVLQYSNSIYPNQILQVEDSFNVRCDSKCLTYVNNQQIYLYFSKPIIANSILITAQPISQSKVVNSNANTSQDITATPTSTVSANTTLQLMFKSMPSLHSVYGILPSATDIQEYQRTAQMATSGNTDTLSLDICPSMNDLIEKQVQAQQLCDTLEYQDKIKSEKIRMDKNKQYLIKLKAQQDQIDNLNKAITQLQSTRSARDKSTDMLRVAQYQNQKNAVSTVRDLANQRLQSQDNNNLYLNVNLK